MQAFNVYGIDPTGRFFEAKVSNTYHLLIFLRTKIWFFVLDGEPGSPWATFGDQDGSIHTISGQVSYKKHFFKVEIVLFVNK